VLANVFDNLKAFTQFTVEDERNVRSLYEPLRENLNEVADAFYDRLVADPVARSLFSGSGQVKRLKGTLHDWLVTLLSAPYDEHYLARRADIGRKHVAVNMPPYLMFAAMNLIRSKLDELIRRNNVPQAEAKRVSLNKILDIELAMMLETFREDYIDKLQRAERQEMEARLKESRQMASVGELAASLAHEIKNPLAGISGAIQVIREKLRPSDPHREILDQVLSQIDRLDNAVKDLLVYSRPTPIKRRTHRVSSLLRQVISLSQTEPALQAMAIHIDGQDDTLCVEVDEHQFQQVMMNLLINAAHASNGRGKIEVRYERRGAEAHIRVVDDGRGMSEAGRLRAFEPFFTTKARGTGLGLAICRKIIAAHQGHMELESQERRGTTVTVILPVSPGPDQPVPALEQA